MFLILALFVFIHSAAGSSDCPPLPGEGLSNGRLNRINTHSVQIVCDKGFVLIGRRTIRCFNGSWTPPFEAECLRPMNICPPPPDVPNADRFGDERSIGSRTFYSCHKDYFLVGQNVIQCEDHLQWDRDPPRCIAKLNKISDIADRIRIEAGLREKVDVPNNVSSDMQGLILDKDVYVKGLELFLLLDRSSSVDPIDLELSKSFFRTLIETFGVDNSLSSKSKTRLAVITFGDKAKVVVHLTNKTINNVESAMVQINAIKPEGGGTAMTDALSTVLEFMGSLRKEAKKAVFLLTDGEPTIGDIPPEDLAKQLEKRSFELFAVGIGRDFNRNRLVKIASKPIENHVFFLDTFKDIETILDLVQNPIPEVPPTPPPGPDACGVAVNGTSMSKPWVTAIVVSFPKEKHANFCAGVLICSEWVLTSGDCVANVPDSKHFSQISVIVGAQDLTKNGHNAYATQVHISAQEPRKRTANFKLALIKLSHPVPSDKARPICMHDHKILKDPFFPEQEVKVLLQGWGTRSWNSSLTTMKLTPSANRHSSLAVNATTLKWYLCSEAVTSRTNIKKPSSDEFLCAGSSQTGNKDHKENSCLGSLGSPLIIKEEQGRYQLLGVQTHHHGCIDQPIIHLSIAPHVKWIQNVTNNCQERHRN